MTTEQVNQRLEAWAKASGRRSVSWTIASRDLRNGRGVHHTEYSVAVRVNGAAVAAGSAWDLADAFADMLEELAEVDEAARTMAAA